MKRNTEWESPEPTMKYGFAWYKTMKWMKMSIRTDLICRRKHIFLGGVTGTGKSTRFAQQLMKRLYTYTIVKDKLQNLNYTNGYDAT